MGRCLGLLGFLACALTACGTSASAPATATPVGPTVPLGTAGATQGPLPTPLPEYSQEFVGKNKYQLINNYTYQFVAVTANGTRSVCPGAGASCTRYVKIGVTEYSGNTPVTVSPSDFALVSASGVRTPPARTQQAKRVENPNTVLQKAQLQPDDDGDFANGTLVFPVHGGADRFSLTWKGHHVATFVMTTRGTLHETR